MSEDRVRASKDSVLAFSPQEWGDDDHDQLVISQGHRKLQIPDNNWTQLGGIVMYGKSGGTIYYPSLGLTNAYGGDWAGHSVSLSSDGMMLAVGAKWYDGSYYGNDNRGHVQVYKYMNGAWTSLEDIVGEHPGDEFGYSVSLSRDGTVLAVGAPRNDNKLETYTIIGHVRVYKYANGAWSQLGGDIDGEIGSYFGSSVSLSSGGNVLAVGAPGASIATPGTNNVGQQVRVYEYVATSGIWTQRGGSIVGEAPGDYSGDTGGVCLSSDGNVLAVGAKLNDPSLLNDAGHVRVYQYANGAWTQLGGDIDGEAAGDMSGSSVSLSSDGTLLAVAAKSTYGYSNTGYARVYKFSNANGGWVQRGSKIIGPSKSVSLSSDGGILAVGEPRYSLSGYMTGRVRVYKYINSDWIQQGNDIVGGGEFYLFGDSISLSSNGSVLAIGAPIGGCKIAQCWVNMENQNGGEVRVYQNMAVSSLRKF